MRRRALLPLRRRALLPFAAMVAVLWVLAGCGGGGGVDGGGGQGQQRPPEETTTPTEEGAITGQFVGEIPETDAFVALVARAPREGEDRGEVRAYLCDGRTINEWFNEGSAEETDLDLTSDGGARLLASLKRDVDSSWVSGQIFLADGTVLGFSAPPATGIAGLYDVSISGGELSGTSEGGARLEGRIFDALQQNGLYPVGGTITPPDGRPQDFQASATPDASGELRIVVLEDGRVKGGPKKGEGEGFVEIGVGV